MNTDIINKVADIIEYVGNDGFNMNLWSVGYPASFIKELDADPTLQLADFEAAQECGTACCIAGWVHAVATQDDYNKDHPRYSEVRTWEMASANTLDIPVRHIGKLLYPDSSFWQRNGSYLANGDWVLDADIAAKTLRRLAAGELYLDLD